jgi:hypothetical protein
MVCLLFQNSLFGMLLVKEPDPFLQHMFARMSPGARFLFTPEQLDEIKKAFSARSRNSHALDLRYSIGLFGKSYYFVFLAGRERRTLPRASINVTKLSQKLALGVAVIAGCLLISVLA